MNLNYELRWAASRPESRWYTLEKNKKKNTTGTNSVCELPMPQFDDPTAFEDCLTTWEHDAYLQYLKKHPSSVYSMNQNPNSRATYAKGEVGVVKACLIVIPVTYISSINDQLPYYHMVLPLLLV